ncbi:hypothetical protein FHG87_015721 [Trinorchestia longiramus]|nr:hypothetical protein FHG87_015721 [Trinorchestia longiramus]
MYSARGRPLPHWAYAEGGTDTRTSGRAEKQVPPEKVAAQKTVLFTNPARRPHDGIDNCILYYYTSCTRTLIRHILHLLYSLCSCKSPATVAIGLDWPFIPEARLYYYYVSCRKNNSQLSKSSFNRIVKGDLKWFPYKMHLRHQLTDDDYVRRENFVGWFLRKPDRFIDNIIVGDELAFFMNGEVNNHNVRKYAPQNNPPDWNFEKSIFQDKLSLWIGLCGNGSLVGPLFYDNNLTGVAYLDLINEAIVPELRHIYAN